MFDEIELLTTDEKLLALLRHYAEAGAEDREAWHDRVMEWEGARRDDLVRLHGLLIGFGWIEQNTGNTPSLRKEAVPLCYRATAGGRRALKQVDSLREEKRKDAA